MQPHHLSTGNAAEEKKMCVPPILSLKYENHQGYRTSFSQYLCFSLRRKIFFRFSLLMAQQ